MIRRIHVNQQIIRANRKYDKRDPVITVKSYKDNTYADEVIIYGQDGLEAARVRYEPDHPLSCGARVWIETRNNVETIVRGQA